MRPIRALLIVTALLLASACGTGGDGGGGPQSTQASGSSTAPNRPSSAIPTDGDPRLADLASGAVESFEVPAVALARVTLEDGIVVGVAGTRSHGDTTPIVAGARFHLGSDTKAMTAVLVAQLVEAGEFSLDDRIVDVLPDAPIDPSRAAITVRDVLGHRTGLADKFEMAALQAYEDPVEARRDAVYAALQEPADLPTTQSYANINYMVAGVIVDQFTGKPWSEVMQDRIFQPLEMATCGFGTPLGDQDPLGHTSDGDPIPQEAPVTDNPPALGPAGTAHCSLGDWGKFITAVLQSLSGTDSPILSAETAAKMFAGDDLYVVGWLRIDRDGEVAYMHDGTNTLWYARAVLRPERGDAVLLATNTGEGSGEAAIDQLTDSLLSE